MTMGTSRRRAGVAMVWAAMLLLAPSVSAEVVVPQLPKRGNVTDAAHKAAAKSYSKAEKRLSRGALKGALKHAQAAYTAVPNASTALLQAIILSEMRRHRAAFTMFLMAADLGATPEELAFIKEGLAKSGKKTIPEMGWITITTEPKGARVTVDNVIVTAPRTVGVSKGQHSIEVVAEGFHTTKAAVTTIVGVGQQVGYKLIKKEVVKAPDPPKPGPEPKAADGNVTTAPVEVAKTADDSDGGLETPGYALVGTGAALLLVGVGMHAWAFDRAAATDELAMPNSEMPEDVRRTQWQQAESDMGLANTLAAVGYAVGGAALVTGIVLLALDPGESAEGTVVAPVTMRGGAGLQTRVRF